MKVLDLECGLKGWSSAFQDNGHDIRTLDIDKRFNPYYLTDIRIWIPDDSFQPDIILASPPCHTFSTMRMGSNWNYDRTPKTESAKESYEILEATIRVIEHYEPRYYIIENPRAYMRTLPIMKRFRRITVSYCRYGERRMKPTDLWGLFPERFVPEPMCHNGNPDHIPSPRGSITGTQGLNPTLSSKVPYLLSKAVHDSIGCKQ